MALRLSLKTKFTLATALLVLAAMALGATFTIAQRTAQVIQDTNERARFVAQQVFFQAQQALQDAADQGAAPADETPEALREYVRDALDGSPGLTSLIEAAVGYSATLYEVSIADTEGTVIVSSDASLPGRRVTPRTPLETFAGAGFLEQLRVLYGPPRIFEVKLPFDLGGRPFGEIRLGLSSALMRSAIEPDLRRAVWLGLAVVLVSTLLAAGVSQVTLAPLSRISAQLDRIARGEAGGEAVTGTDELGQVSTKISKIGQELRGVREIFSTLRENLNQIMTGLEDGLLLFTRDGRAVMASPAAEKVLGVQASALLGRRASEIFPTGHPMRSALKFEGEQLEAVSGAEVQLVGAAGGTPSRVGVSVQVIREGNTRMGAMVTMRDLESLEQIGTQLQVSERLAALGRVTAGVAHEVKNPLNSMRLWLENLRESLAPGQEIPQQAVKILDSEIDRLDRVVKTFLNFNKPVELHLEETNLAELLEETLTIAKPQIEQAGVAVKLEAPAGMPPVRADRQLLKQAILNLVLNACEVMSAQRDATSQGGKLILSVARDEKDAVIRVSDTGPGIPPEFRAKIFQLYFTTRQGGSGIGLATTFRIVQFHSGSIDFETEVGRGTTFRIELPLAH